jgi:predicted ATPase with chaperone activity
MMDRIDIHVEVPRVDYDKLSSDQLGEPSVAVRDRVEAARDVQRARFERARADGALPVGRRLTCNADMGPAEVRVYCNAGVAARGPGGQEPATRSHAAVAHVGAGVPSYPQAGADDRRPVRE